MDKRIVIIIKHQDFHENDQDQRIISISYIFNEETIIREMLSVIAAACGDEKPIATTLIKYNNSLRCFNEEVKVSRLVSFLGQNSLTVYYPCGLGVVIDRFEGII